MCGPEFASGVAAVGDGLDVVGGEAHGMFPGEGVVYGVPAEPTWEVVPAGFSLEGFAEVSVCPVVSHAGTGLLCYVVGALFLSRGGLSFGWAGCRLVSARGVHESVWRGVFFVGAGHVSSTAHCCSREPP